MTNLFLSLLDMSLSASYVILVVYLLRWFWGFSNLPKRYSYILWGFVLIRLLVPAMPETNYSMLPEDFTDGYVEQWSESTPVGTATSELQPTEPSDTSPVGAVVPAARPTTDALANASAFSRLTPALSHLWLTGMALMILYNARSLLRLRQTLAESIPTGEGIYLCDHIDTAFVIGLLCPRIYLPAHLTNTEQGFVIAHERYHIRRKDHLVKLIAFAALILHWFNPLVWLAFAAAMQDMELSCDEAVTGNMDSDTRSDYAHTLLTLTAGHKHFAIAPVAFGEGDVSQRIRHVFSYRKPAAVVTAVIMILLVCLIPGLLTNRANPTGHFGASVYYEKENGFTYKDPNSNMTGYVEGPYLLTTDNHFFLYNDLAGWMDVGYAEDYFVSADELAYMMRYRHAFDPVPVTEILDSKIVTYKDGPLNMYYLLTRHKDGQLYISYGSCMNDLYSYKDMYIYKLAAVHPSLDENSSNSPFYTQALSSMLRLDVTPFGTYHFGNGYQAVGFFTTAEPSDFDVGWAVFRISDGMIEYLEQRQLFPNKDYHNGILHSSRPVTVDGEEYEIILIYNPNINSVQTEVNGIHTTHYIQAPDMLVVPAEATDTVIRCYDAEGKAVSIYDELAENDTQDYERILQELQELQAKVTDLQLVQIDGRLFYNTMETRDTKGPPAVGVIDSTVPAGQIPTKDNQSNFGSGYAYRFDVTPDDLQVGIDGKIYQFRLLDEAPAQQDQWNVQNGQELKLMKELEPCEEAAQSLLKDPHADIDLPAGIRRAAVYNGIVQFDYAIGTAPYSGMYYSPDDLPAAFQNADVELTEIADGWTWQAEGDNHGTTSRITRNWFRYEAWM